MTWAFQTPQMVAPWCGCIPADYNRKMSSNMNEIQVKEKKVDDINTTNWVILQFNERLQADESLRRNEGKPIVVQVSIVKWKSYVLLDFAVMKNTEHVQRLKAARVDEDTVQKFVKRTIVQVPAQPNLGCQYANETLMKRTSSQLLQIPQVPKR